MRKKIPDHFECLTQENSLIIFNDYYDFNDNSHSVNLLPYIVEGALHMWLTSGDCLGVPYGITSVLRDKRDRQKGDRGKCDALRDWPRRWVWSLRIQRLQGRRQAVPVEGGRGTKTESILRSQGGRQSCKRLHFNHEVFVALWPVEVQDNKFVLCSATKFMVLFSHRQ